MLKIIGKFVTQVQSELLIYPKQKKGQQNLCAYFMFVWSLDIHKHVYVSWFVWWTKWYPPPPNPQRILPNHSLSNTVIMKTYGLLPDQAWIWLDFPDFKHDYRKEVYLSDVCCQPPVSWPVIFTVTANTSISQMLQCIRQIIHNAPLCNRNVHMCAHSCFKVVFCGLWDWCIMGFVICEMDLFISGSCKIWQWY